jgi:hypothetical protein
MKTFRVVWLSLFTAFIVLAGCNSIAPLLPLDESASKSAATYDPATATGRVSGSTKFEGKPPVMAALQPGGSRFCATRARFYFNDKYFSMQSSRARTLFSCRREL